MKSILTDRSLKAAKPATTGTRRMIWDGVVPSFGARVTDKGRISFVVLRRLDGKLVRHTLGTYPGMTLEQARQQARDALGEIGRGQHPKAKAEAERREREVRSRDSFEAAAEAFIGKHVATLRSRKAVEAAIRRDLISRWRRRPITAITRSDVTAVIREVSAGRGRYAAHKLLAYVSKLFGWAIAQDLYGLERSPCDHIKPADLIGRKVARRRVLSDDELRWFWRATAETPYPFGPLFRFLLLTGLRRSEAANMPWGEVDLPQALWSIPAERMKEEAAFHVPLSTEAASLLSALPRFDGAGDKIFTTTAGRRPVSGFSKVKARLDKAMRDLAGEGVVIKHWVPHDLRRTVRTRFSGIPAPDLVRELALSHTQDTLHAVYDQYAYLDERRALLDAWATRLMAIVEPPDDPGKVVPFSRPA